MAVSFPVNDSSNWQSSTPLFRVLKMALFGSSRVRSNTLSRAVDGLLGEDWQGFEQGGRMTPGNPATASAEAHPAAIGGSSTAPLRAS